MENILKIVQVITSIGLILLILIQSKGVGLGMTFSGTSTLYRSKRGVEKIVFITTIAFAALFGASSLLNVILR